MSPPEDRQAPLQAECATIVVGASKKCRNLKVQTARTSQGHNAGLQTAAAGHSVGPAGPWAATELQQHRRNANSDANDDVEALRGKEQVLATVSVDCGRA